jgi:hypothetical protein
VLAGRFPIEHRTHGAALTPDETELWISDQVGKKLFIFDATPISAGSEGSRRPEYRRPRWVNFSIDGAYAWSHAP